MEEKNSSLKNALFLGSLCAISYLAVYVARNILSTVTPQMIESGSFTKEYIGEVSSLFFIFYAMGQLLNGIIGDKIKARYMMTLGLTLAGVTVLAFPYIATNAFGAKAVYSMTGFFLSMIYAPMTKVVAENIVPLYATRCSLSYSLASYLGSPVAGIFASIFVWQNAFISSAIFLFVMAFACFASLWLLEKKGVVKHNRFKKELSEAKQNGSIRLLIKRRIIIFSLVSILTGIVRTTVVFWLPTYFNEYLGYSPTKSASIFTVATLAITLTVFVTMFAYELFKRDMDATMLTMFIIASLCFLLVFLVKQPIINIIFIILAIIASNSAATILWSMYCPSLKDTGMVSSATGFLTFIGYIGSSASSYVFAYMAGAENIGWRLIVLVWFMLMIFGVLVTLPYRKIITKFKKP